MVHESPHLSTESVDWHLQCVSVLHPTREKSDLGSGSCHMHLDKLRRHEIQQNDLLSKMEARTGDTYTFLLQHDRRLVP